MADISREHVMTHMRVMINNSASARRGLKAEVSARARRYHDSTVSKLPRYRRSSIRGVRAAEECVTLRDASRALLEQIERESEGSVRGAMGTFRSAAVALDEDEEEEEEKKRREVERLPPLLEDEVSLIDSLPPTHSIEMLISHIFNITVISHESINV